MRSSENQTQVIEKCGPCRDRTYDQLIKRPHTGNVTSCSADSVKSAIQRLETTPFHGILEAAFARYLGAYSKDATRG